jgi:CRP-like cAMP-binding protein
MATSTLQSLPLRNPPPVTLVLDLEPRALPRPVHSFRRGQEIPLWSDQVWVLQKGVVLLNTLYPSGDEALLGVIGLSMPFGLPLSLVDPYQAIAFCDVEAVSYSMQEVERSPVLLQEISRNLCRRLQQAETMVALLGQRRVEERLKQFLQMLAQELGQTVSTGTRLDLRLTHQHLANALGTTRVTVTRILNQLRDAGWLSFDQGRHIVISGS